MTVGKPEYNLDSFGIKYVRKGTFADSLTQGDAKPTGSTPSTTKLPKSGADAPKDSLDLAASSSTSNLTNPSEHQQGKVTTYGEGSSGAQHGGKTTQGDKTNTGDRAITDGIGGTKKNPSYDRNNNEVIYKKPEGQTLPKNASLNLAIIKCKLLKVKALSGDANYSSSKPTKEPVSGIAEPEHEKLNSRNQRPLDPDSDDDRSFGEIRSQSTPKEKGTGDKIPAEKLGDLPVGKVDEKEVGGTEIEDQHGKTRKLVSPHEAYKAEVRKTAIDAIDMAMKTISIYQDKKEKSLQEELIKDAYEAQLKNDSANTSDGVNAVYSDVHQKKINKQ